MLRPRHWSFCTIPLLPLTPMCIIGIKPFNFECFVVCHSNDGILDLSCIFTCCTRETTSVHWKSNASTASFMHDININCHNGAALFDWNLALSCKYCCRGSTKFGKCAKCEKFLIETAAGSRPHHDYLRHALSLGVTGGSPWIGLLLGPADPGVSRTSPPPLRQKGVFTSARAARCACVPIV